MSQPLPQICQECREPDYRGFLVASLSENLAHMRHVESERITFVSIFLAVMGVAAVFITEASMSIVTFVLMALTLIALNTLCLTLIMRWNKVFRGHGEIAKRLAVQIELLGRGVRLENLDCMAARILAKGRPARPEEGCAFGSAEAGGPACPLADGCADGEVCRNGGLCNIGKGCVAGPGQNACPKIHINRNYYFDNKRGRGFYVSTHELFVMFNVATFMLIVVALTVALMRR